MLRIEVMDGLWRRRTERLSSAFVRVGGGGRAASEKFAVSVSLSEVRGPLYLSFVRREAIM